MFNNIFQSLKRKQIVNYMFQFLCCESVECLPQLVRRIADLSFKKSVSTFEEGSKEKWLNRSFITPDPTKVLPFVVIIKLLLY